MIGSDGLPHDQHPHPRLWGTFPRVLGHYSRDLGLFPLETAVHKMTGLSARQFRLADRGEFRAGACADVSCSMRRRSATPRPSSSRRHAPSASTACW